MNGGTSVMACIINPGSQSGYAVLAVQNLSTRETTYFNHLFGAMVSGYEYINDTTVVAHKDNTDTILDVAALSFTEINYSNGEDLQVYSGDYAHFITAKFTTLQDSQEQFILYSGLNTKTQPIFTTTGGLCRVDATTENYAILYIQDAKTNKYIAVKF